MAMTASGSLHDVNVQTVRLKHSVMLKEPDTAKYLDVRTHLGTSSRLTTWFVAGRGRAFLYYLNLSPNEV